MKNMIFTYCLSVCECVQRVQLNFEWREFLLLLDGYRVLLVRHFQVTLITI